MGIGRFFKKVSHGANKLFHKVSNDVSTVFKKGGTIEKGIGTAVKQIEHSAPAVLGGIGQGIQYGTNAINMINKTPFGPALSPITGFAGRTLGTAANMVKLGSNILEKAKAPQGRDTGPSYV